MKILCRNTISGLVPLYPSDYDNKRKLKLGQDYECDITNPRNVGFHRKFFALLNIGFENSGLRLPFEVYRKHILIKAGYFKVYTIEDKVYYEAESISFASKSQDEFEEIYSRVCDIILADIGATREDIEKQLINFL